jgi:hypothetical protein
MNGAGAELYLMASFSTDIFELLFFYYKKLNICNRKRQADTFALICK